MIYEEIKHIHLDSVDSTNEWIKEHKSDFDLDKLICVSANEQLKGKGCDDHIWVSPKDVNIYASFYFTLPNSRISLLNLPQVMAMSCVKLLERHDLSAQIKWPNDLLVENKKIGGILGETFEDGFILGIGLNVNMDQSTADSIDQPATSMKLESHKEYSTGELLHELQTIFKEDLNTFFKEGFKPFHDFCTFHLAYLGQNIQWSNGKDILRGNLRALLMDGTLELCIKPEDCIRISSGFIKPL